MSWLNVIKDLISPVTKLLDVATTTDEERLTLKNTLTELENELTAKFIDLEMQRVELEKQLLTAQSSIINAESKSESWIARSWRPITMLTFLAIIVLHSLGAIELAPEFADKFMTLVQIGLGGYVVGRSAEKLAPSINKFKRN